jgi:hypothetical protein
VARWGEIVASEPELAARAKASFDVHIHKTIATLRRDGSPRISGIELTFAADDVWIGSMRDAVKARDLRRDPRYAIHSASGEGAGWIGDAKLAGSAEEVTDQATLDAVYPPEPGAESTRSIESMHLFRLEIDELVWTGLNEARDKLLIESWHPGRGRRLIER